MVVFQDIRALSLDKRKAMLIKITIPNKACISDNGNYGKKVITEPPPMPFTPLEKPFIDLGTRVTHGE